MYLNISCICNNSTTNHLIFGQQSYWIYTAGKSLIMKLGPGFLSISQSNVYTVTIFTILLLASLR